MRSFLVYLCCCFAINANTQENSVKPGIPQQVWALTEVLYHDVVNPPAAARFYAYSLLTGYEILCQVDSSQIRFQQEVHGYPLFLIRSEQKNIDKNLAVLFGILETGKEMIPSGFLLEEKQKSLVQAFKSQDVSDEVIDVSISMARQISRIVIQYSRSDGYFNLSTKRRYKPGNSEESWKPTAPEYMSAVEPNWNSIRPFFIDSVTQFRPIPAVQFEKEHNSLFYQLMKEVYEVSRILSAEQKQIADFWDCNPFAVQYQGHMSIGLKKISPGGHWMGITGIAAEKAGLNFNNEMLIHTLVALTLHDAFTSCWDEKYRSNRIRPETAINRYMDEKWKPYLQTPPFPEYSSGHSVISTAVAELLTYFLGDKFAFTDSTEAYIGLRPRKFNSFHEAAAEARISRLYGGIHFRDAIENGADQGMKIGTFIIERMKRLKIKKLKVKNER